MASKLLVALQFVALAAVVWPWTAGSWNRWAWLPIGLAFAIAAWSIAHNPPANFSIFPEPRANARLVTSGPYAHVRHPMYAALIVFAAGVALGWNTPIHWCAAAALAVVLDRKTWREERLLRVRFPDYADYSARTPRLVPALRRAAS